MAFPCLFILRMVTRMTSTLYVSNHPTAYPLSPFNGHHTAMNVTLDLPSELTVYSSSCLLPLAI